MHGCLYHLYFWLQNFAPNHTMHVVMQADLENNTFCMICAITHHHDKSNMYWYLIIYFNEILFSWHLCMCVCVCETIHGHRDTIMYIAHSCTYSPIYIQCATLCNIALKRVLFKWSYIMNVYISALFLLQILQNGM